MSDSRKKSTQEKAGNPALDWFLRTFVFGILAVLLVLAVLDFQAKQSATKTAEAWKAALRAKGEEHDFTKSELSNIAISGKPTMIAGEAGPNSFHARTLETYTWKGTFRTYAVKVYFGLGSDAPVEQIEGPGPAVSD